MKRNQRLTEASRFQQIRKNGDCWSDQYLVVCVLPNGLSISRFGFSVSRRIGGAVVRNRVRRRVREAVRLQLPKIVLGYDVVFVARGPVVLATYSLVEESVTRLLRQASLMTIEPERA